MSTSSRHRRPGVSGNRYNVEVTPRKTLDEFRERVGQAGPNDAFSCLTAVAKSWIRSTAEFIMDLEEDGYDEIRIFPKLGIFLMMTLTFWSRNILVTNFEGLAIVHPDENFQAIEVAHSEVYGYGFRMNAYEPPSGQDLYDDDPLANRGHMSWLYVHLYIVLFRLREYFRWAAPPFVVARTFFSVWSALLPFAVYKLGRTLFQQSRDIGFIAASLVAFSKHTMIYGTHPLASSFATTIVVAALTVALRSLTTATSYESSQYRHRLNITPHHPISDFVVASACGFALAFAVAIKPDASIAVLGFALLFFPFRLAIVGWLPSRATLSFIVAMILGAATNFAIIAAHHHHLFGQWRVPLIPWLKEQLFDPTTSDVSARQVLIAFLRCSHVHLVLAATILLISFCYLLRSARLTRFFDDWMNSNDLILFRNIFRLGALTTVLASVYLIIGWREYAFAQELMVTSMLAGSAAVYLLFRRLYVYVIDLAAPQQVTRNIIKLVLYGELFLYMFESRVTFPGTADRRIADWSYGSCWESAHVNRCLQFVGAQPDVTGVAINYTLAMTGAYSLLHHDVPIFGRTFGDYREWTGQSRTNVTGVFGLTNVSATTLDGAADVISLDNAALFYRRLAENTVYNYIITNGTSAKLFRTGFREVYNASDFRVFKRAKSRTEREALFGSVADVPLGSEATVLAEEGRKLIALRLFAKAAERLRLAVELEADDIGAWRNLLTSLTQLELYDELSASREICRRRHGESCLV